MPRACSARTKWCASCSGDLDAVAISSGSLPHLDDSVDVLNIPLLFETYEELGFVRDRIAPELEQRLGRGFRC
jgi:TRAP-type C4-dicarboxylate transport system substrate-binding protein